MADPGIRIMCGRISSIKLNLALGIGVAFGHSRYRVLDIAIGGGGGGEEGERTNDQSCDSSAEGVSK